MAKSKKIKMIALGPTSGPDGHISPKDEFEVSSEEEAKELEEQNIAVRADSVDDKEDLEYADDLPEYPSSDEAAYLLAANSAKTEDSVGGAGNKEFDIGERYIRNHNTGYVRYPKSDKE